MGGKKIRYAVAGLGWISQAAVLPAFKNTGNCDLAALFSGHPEKRKQLSERYEVPAYSYEDYDAVLQRGEIDAVYIALPNHLHAEYTERSAQAGVHVLCETPMALTEEDCERMISVCARNYVKLMLAYRLHFDEMSLEAMDEVRSDRIGDPRCFMSLISQPAHAGELRVRRATGGGTFYDLGMYCINAARNLFASEPTEALAVTTGSNQSRFGDVEETGSGILRFPRERLAAFTCSFGASIASTYRVLGTKGGLRANPAYCMDQSLKYQLTVEGNTVQRKFRRSDQFAPELIYFADCILSGNEPEPDGWEGLADVRIIRALYRSAETAAPVKLGPFVRTRRPEISQEMFKRAVRKPDLVHARAPSEAV